MLRNTNFLLQRGNNVFTRSSTTMFQSKYLSEELATKSKGSVTLQKAIRLSNFIDKFCNTEKEHKIAERQYYSDLKKEKEMALIYWNSLEIPSLTEELPTEFVEQFRRDISGMNTSRIIQLFYIMSKKNVHHKLLLDHIGDQLMSRTIKQSVELRAVMFSMSKLTYLNAELITKFKNEFLVGLQRNLTYDHKHLQDILLSFAYLHLSDQKFWYEIIHWIEPKLRNNKFKLDFTPFSVANVDVRLLKRIKEMVGKVNRSELTPGKWIGYIHTLAVLRMVDSSSVASIFNNSFIKELKKQQKYNNLSRFAITYDDIRYRNILNAAKLEFPNYHNEEVPCQINEPKKDILEIMRRIKFGDEEDSTLTDFGLMLRLVVPLKSRSTGPEWHSSGAILEGRCFVDIDKRQFVKLKEMEQQSGNESDKRNVKEVAILFFTENHLTRIFDKEDVGERRLLGMYQMNVRHLLAMGIHPVIFTADQFDCSGLDELKKVELIRNRILDLSTDFHDNNWSDFSSSTEEL